MIGDFSFRIVKMLECYEGEEIEDIYLTPYEDADEEELDREVNVFYTLYARKEGYLEMALGDFCEYDEASQAINTVKGFYKLIKSGAFDIGDGSNPDDNTWIVTNFNN
jgi:hypothetical protein